MDTCILYTSTSWITVVTSTISHEAHSITHRSSQLLLTLSNNSGVGRNSKSTLTLMNSHSPPSIFGTGLSIHTKGLPRNGLQKKKLGRGSTALILQGKPSSAKFESRRDDSSGENERITDE